VERLNGLLEDIKGRLKVHEKQAQEPTGADAGNIHLAIRSVKELQLEMTQNYFKMFCFSFDRFREEMINHHKTLNTQELFFSQNTVISRTRN
jgi:hypothetical protein